MNTLLFRLKVVTLIIVSVLTMSCNLIISNISSRINPNDPEAQISNFNAFALDVDKVLTTWQWNEYYHDSDERIEEIRILHSTNNYPQVLIPFTGESITDSSKTELEWKGLDKNTTHYFALHMKDERNRWYSPIYAKATLPGTVVTGFVFNRINSVNADSASAEWMPDNPLEIRDWKWAVLYFDIPDGVYINNATIYLSPSGSATGVTFAPVIEPLPDDDMEIYNSLKDDFRVDYSKSITFTTIESTYDITEVVRAAALSSEKAILIKTEDMTPPTLNYDNDASAPYIIADIIK